MQAVANRNLCSPRRHFSSSVRILAVIFSQLLLLLRGLNGFRCQWRKASRRLDCWNITDICDRIFVRV